MEPRLAFIFLQHVDDLQRIEQDLELFLSQFGYHSPVGLHLRCQLPRPLQHQSAIDVRTASKATDRSALSCLLGNAFDAHGSRCCL